MLIRYLTAKPLPFQTPPLTPHMLLLHIPYKLQALVYCVNVDGLLNKLTMEINSQGQDSGRANNFFFLKG